MPIKKEITKETNTVSTIGKGLFISILISLILILIYGLLLTYTGISESSMPTVIMVITIISIGLSSIYVAMRVTSRGWLNGAITGLLYMIIVFLISLLFKTGISMDKFILFRMLMGFIIGALAGIIGINLK
jgi:putative membrane protein (TIGR04086 family)